MQQAPRGGRLQIRLGRCFTVAMERVPHGGVEDLLEVPPLDDSRAGCRGPAGPPTPVLNKGRCKPERRAQGSPRLLFLVTEPRPPGSRPTWLWIGAPPGQEQDQLGYVREGTYERLQGLRLCGGLEAPARRMGRDQGLRKPGHGSPWLGGHSGHSLPVGPSQTCS